MKYWSRKKTQCHRCSEYSGFICSNIPHVRQDWIREYTASRVWVCARELPRLWLYREEPPCAFRCFCSTVERRRFHTHHLNFWTATPHWIYHLFGPRFWFEYGKAHTAQMRVPRIYYRWWDMGRHNIKHNIGI